MMRWKWATTKVVLWRYSSRIGWARMGPVRPPVMKRLTKPRAKSMGVVYRGFARQMVASQLRTLAEAGEDGDVDLGVSEEPEEMEPEEGAAVAAAVEDSADEVAGGEEEAGVGV